MERFFLSLKMERVWRRDYANHAEAIRDITEYSVGFYNNKRLHSKLGDLPPTAYERAMALKSPITGGGFSNNPEVKIELPGNLGKVAKKMKQFGMGDQVDQLETSMNKAAEAAVTQAQALLVDAVKKMTVTDAKGILGGDQDSAGRKLYNWPAHQLSQAPCRTAFCANSSAA